MQRRFAIILGGGRSARMGRDKRSLRLGGRSLLAIAVDACADRDMIVAVTPDLPDDVAAGRVRCTLEDPPFGGPVAGIAAGMAALPPAERDDEVLVLACDLPHAGEIVAILDAASLVDGAGGESTPEAPAGSADRGLDRPDSRGHDRPQFDCTCLVDAEGYPQYLAARYRRTALQDRLAAVGETRGTSVRRLMAGLSVRHIPAAEIATDVDTPDEAAAAGIS